MYLVNLLRNRIKKAIFSVSRPVVVIGGGGHASVLIDILREQGREIRAFICPSFIDRQCAFAGLVHYKKDEDIHLFDVAEVELINGIGALPHSKLRANILEKYTANGFKFGSVVASSALVSPFALLGEGVQLLHGAIVQAGSAIGAHSILNTASVVDHDCNIGELNHVAIGARICGGVTTGSCVFIGAGAIVIQSVDIGCSSVVGAGAVVTKNIEIGGTAYPCRPLVKVD